MKFPITLFCVLWHGLNWPWWVCLLVVIAANVAWPWLWSRLPTPKEK